MKIKIIILLFFCVCNLQSYTQNNTVNNNSKKAPKNVIVMIADGMGYNHLAATNYYLFGTQDSCLFTVHNFKKLAQATYSAQLKDKDDTVWSQGYNPHITYIKPNTLSQGATCSAASATALSTGKKTYNGAIGLGVHKDTLTHIINVAHKIGKKTGIVTSVQFSHATPAGFSAYNERRNNYPEIAQYQILVSPLDVLMGAGHPLYDDAGKSQDGSYKYVGGKELWQEIKKTTASHILNVNSKQYTLKDSKGNPHPWTLIEDSLAFACLLGPNPPKRVLGVPKVHRTLQQTRPLLKGKHLPFETPFNKNLPDLTLMTQGALNILSWENKNGFFLMIEGGAVDWASHDNQSGRMIEEMIDFLNAVNAVIEWVEKHSSWEETLLIITADHECGFLWGTQGPETCNPIINKGKGNIPDMKWYTDDHTNSLVPFFAKGSCAHMIDLFADEYDPIHGYFLQNTEIAQLLFFLWDNKNQYVNTIPNIDNN